MEGFGRLPEECISEILSLTTALDASRSSILSKEFRSAGSDDVVWERFLPPDYEDIISASVSPVTYDSKKQLYLTLSHSPIFINGGKMVT
ncbi:F-box protein [Sesamum angolense]|uniref:F-box protein n=1 Tax=Sesamum angolense TaxID=2727404 RepID=A0AAE1W798_9LAMI|nr:F-box protein [Sesamum angolense]